MSDCPEVSVDSDRDSVLESEDGKEVTVRGIFSKFSAFFYFEITQVGEKNILFIIQQQSDEDLDQEEETSPNNIKKVKRLQIYM